MMLPIYKIKATVVIWDFNEERMYFLSTIVKEPFENDELALNTPSDGTGNHMELDTLWHELLKDKHR